MKKMKIEERNIKISEELKHIEASCGACKEAFCCKWSRGIFCSEQEWKEIKKHISPEIKKKGKKIVGQKMYTCPFLSENKCLIYSVRPMVCTVYLVNSNKNFCNSKLLPDAEVMFYSTVDILLWLNKKGLINKKDQSRGLDFRDWFKK